MFWQPYPDSVPGRPDAVPPGSALLAHYPARADGHFATGCAEMRADEATGRFLPLMARGNWVIVVDARGEVLGTLQADGFI